MFAPERDFEGWCICLSAHAGRDDSDGLGYPAGHWWGLVTPENLVVCAMPDLGGNPLCDVNHWLLPLTGYRREEFLEEYWRD